MFLAAAVLHAFEPERPGRPMAFRAVNLPHSQKVALAGLDGLSANPLAAMEDRNCW